jgi:hypothetical protein
MTKSKPFYRGDLPHFHPDDRPYFLTFRLAGSERKDDELLSALLIRQNFLEYDRILDSIKSGPHSEWEIRTCHVVCFEQPREGWDRQALARFVDGLSES